MTSEELLLCGICSLIGIVCCGQLALLVIFRLEKTFNTAIERENENKEHIKSLTLLANLDPLTGLANRRYLDKYIKTVFHMTLTVIMIDVDEFKIYNDVYGHQKGDECLVRLALCFENCVRRCDLVARYGGEEFIIVMPRSDCAEAVSVAKRIKEKVEAMEICHEASKLGYVTVSQGIAEWKPGMDKEKLIEVADSALYRVKENGRNGYFVNNCTV